MSTVPDFHPLQCRLRIPADCDQGVLLGCHPDAESSPIRELPVQGSDLSVAGVWQPRGAPSCGAGGLSHACLPCPGSQAPSAGGAPGAATGLPTVSWHAALGVPMRSFPCTFCGHSNPPSSVHHPSTNTHTSIHPSIHPHICVHPTLQLAQEWIPGLLAYFHGPLGYFSLGARAVPFTMGCLLGLQRLEPVGWAALRRRDAGVACTTAVVVAAWTAWVPLSRPFLAAGDGPAWPHAGSPRAATPLSLIHI